MKYTKCEVEGLLNSVDKLGIKLSKTTIKNILQDLLDQIKENEQFSKIK